MRIDARIEPLMRGLMSQATFAGVVPSENVIFLVFVSAVNLLSSCRRNEEHWWDYLDRAEAALEVA